MELLVAEHPDAGSVARRRIRAWLIWCRKRYAHAFPTQKAFADALGVTNATMTNIISGKRDPALDVLVLLNQRFHVSSDVVLNSDPPNEQDDGVPVPLRPKR